MPPRRATQQQRSVGCRIPMLDPVSRHLFAAFRCGLSRRIAAAYLADASAAISTVTEHDSPPVAEPLPRHIILGDLTA